MNIKCFLIQGHYLKETTNYLQDDKHGTHKKVEWVYFEFEVTKASSSQDFLGFVKTSTRSHKFTQM